MKHTMNLNDAPYRMIECGRKTIELRLYDEKRQLIAVGDQITFCHSEDSSKTLLCRVKSLHRFDSFRELYDSLPLLKCGYTENDLDTASYTDMEQYYTKEKQEQYGVIGIELELCQ